ncbi:MAG: hypothetical protein ACTSU4_01115 [Promethearchaeota archaeon]
MILIIIMAIFNVMFIGIISIIIFNEIKKWKSIHNQILLFIICYLIIVIVHAVWQTFYEIFNFQEIFKLIDNLTVFNFFYLLLLLFATEIVLYINGWKMLYSIPLIACFFIAYGMIMNESVIVIDYYLGIVVSNAIILVLIYEGYKNESGTVFSTGIFMFLFGLGFYPNFLFPGILIKFLGSMVLLFGSFGLFERMIFIDEEREQKIKNTWIAKIVDLKE